MGVASVVTDESWRRNNSWTTQDGMDKCKIRPTKLVSQKAVYIKRICKDNSVSFAIIKAECRALVGCVLPFIRVFDRVVVLSSQNVSRRCTVDVLVLCYVPQFCDYFGWHSNVTRRENVLKWVWSGVGVVVRVSTGDGEAHK
ncbi:hypothetical protein AUR66_11180 [Haloferax profundi]|uniref:Uncharacterized protein n=1 Tax=Haloferax profundi TaxID=1544718 RepID=A0A0W1SRV0_9EURY|nr:hypothetical protein AUR66_11180 [Haloferax profundi]